ncbi:MAG: hypothetical protein H0T46_12080 [Deltaproteobacteria bacterium]|nr:hypothetical protein [Deltaproteobacteria bacterium]
MSKVSRLPVLGAIAALTSACHPAIVLARTTSLELNGGLTDVDGDPDASMARSGLAWNVGLALNFEFQATELLRLGIGAGYTHVSLPEEGPVESHSVGSALAHLYLDVRLKASSGGTFVPRMTLGGTRGGDGVTTTGYLGVGGAFPQANSWAIHVTTGPHWLAVYDFATKSHSGWGWHARVRLRRAWFDCRNETAGTCD